MSYCPSCGAEVASDATQCAKCGAILEDDAAGKPLDERPTPPPETLGAHIAYWIMKAVLGLLSLAVLGMAATIAHSEHNDRWTVVSVIAMLGVIFVAIRAKVRWSFLVLFASMLFGLASCFANFRWHGG